MNTLYIDTRNNHEIIIGLEAENNKFEKKSVASRDRAQAALPLIEGLLKDANLKVNDISEINVETSQGSYTGLRVGVAIANALGFANSVKVNGKSVGEIVHPDY